MAEHQKNIDFSSYDTLIGCAYDAAANAPLWTKFLQQLGETLNATCGVLYRLDLNNHNVSIIAIWGFSEQDTLMNLTGNAFSEPLIPIIEAITDDHLGASPVTLPAPILAQGTLFNLSQTSSEQFFCVGGTVVNHSSYVVSLGLLRSSEKGGLAEEENALLNALAPHLRRAFRINYYHDTIKRDGIATSEILHRIPMGIVLVDATAKPIFINRQADTMASTSECLRIGHASLTAYTSKENKLLHQLISNATCENAVEQESGAMSITCPSTQQALQILVTPLKQSHMLVEVSDPNHTAIVFISNPDRRKEFSLRVLCSLYGLTTAEARTARELANGQSVEEVAQILNVSKNTVRSHLKAIFQKTRLNRQSELIKLVLSGPAGLAH